MRKLRRLTSIAAILVISASGCRTRAPAAGSAPALQAHIDKVLPDTRAARQLSALLLACNSAELSRMQDFGSSPSGRALPELTRQVVSFYREARELDVAAVENSNPGEIVAQIRSTVTDQWYQVSLAVDSGSPATITSFNRRTIPAPVGSKKGRTDRELLAEVEAYLDRLVRSDLFSGVVLIAKSRKPIFEKAYGFSHRDPAIRNELATQFDLASVTKLFTGVAIAQLAEQGRLSFSDTISRHLPDYPNPTIARKVSIHQLLTHSSGMGELLGARFDATKDRPRASTDYFPFFAQNPLAFEPGAGVQYSNSGFVVLGAIVERVSGQTFFDYLQDHVFNPANMKHTAAYPKDVLAPTRAIGYTYVDPVTQSDLLRRESNVPRLPYIGNAAGGGYSTAADLLNFVVELQDHVLLSKEDTDLVMTGKVATRRGEGNKHAYGFEDELVNQHRIVGHSGGFRGVNTQLDIYPYDDYVVVVLSNYAPPRPRFMYSGWAAMFYKNSFSDWHFHPGTDAMMCQVMGTKDVLLLPPTQQSWNQIVPIHIAQWQAYDVDVTKSPAYGEIHPYHVVVEPGDGLFLPVNWWHTVQARSQEYGIAIPITWDTPYRDLRQPATRHFLRVLWQARKPVAAVALLASAYSTTAIRVRESFERRTH